LLDDDLPGTSQGSRTTDELIDRDLAAVRLETVHEMITIEPLLNARNDIKDGVLKKLESSDPAVLDCARLELLELSQGIFEDDVNAALEQGMWDAYFEPTTLTDQDVLRGSFIFRSRSLERSAARSRFQCYWKISEETPAEIRAAAARTSRQPAPQVIPTEPEQPGIEPGEAWELGWEFQLIPKPGRLTIRPEVYDSSGKVVAIRASRDGGEGKGVETFPIAPPARKLFKRSLRGLLDATITALVPVITVAVTQLQNGGSTSIGKLLLLGFTSQAIRAAVVPDPVASASNSMPAKSPGESAGSPR
jgi:hypothetical protein